MSLLWGIVESLLWGIVVPKTAGLTECQTRWTRWVTELDTEQQGRNKDDEEEMSWLSWTLTLLQKSPTPHQVQAMQNPLGEATLHHPHPTPLQSEAAPIEDALLCS